MINDIISAVNDALYSYILIILLIAGGIYFTIRTRFASFRLLGEQFRAVMEKSDGGVSSFQALMGGMTLINMPVIFILSKYALRALKDYEKQRREGEPPLAIPAFCDNLLCRNRKNGRGIQYCFMAPTLRQNTCFQSRRYRTSSRSGLLEMTIAI